MQQNFSVPHAFGRSTHLFVKIEYHRVPETNSLIILFKWEQILKLVEVSFVLIDDVNEDILNSIRYNMERNWDKFVESIIANAGDGNTFWAAGAHKSLYTKNALLNTGAIKKLPKDSYVIIGSADATDISYERSGLGAYDKPWRIKYSTEAHSYRIDGHDGIMYFAQDRMQIIHPYGNETINNCNRFSYERSLTIDDPLDFSVEPKPTKGKSHLFLYCQNKLMAHHNSIGRVSEEEALDVIMAGFFINLNVFCEMFKYMEPLINRYMFEMTCVNYGHVFEHEIGKKQLKMAAEFISRC